MKEVMQKASNLRRDKRYKEAIDLLENIYKDNWEQMDEWSAWSYAYSLRQEKDYNKAIEVCEKSLDRWPAFIQFNNVYSWSLHYEFLVNNSELNIEKKRECVDKILHYSTFDKFSPRTKSVLTLVKLLKEGQMYAEMLCYLEKLKIKSLSDENYKYKSRDGKTITLSSELELYYNYLTEALLKTEEYQSCIDESTRALATIKSFQNNNDFWLSRRMAKSYQELGNIAEARKIYEELIAKKKDWFLFAELAQILYDSKLIEESLKYALTGAKEFGEIEKKVNLIELLGMILEKLGKKEESEWHYYLTYKIRQKEGWKTSDWLENKIAAIERGKVIEIEYKELVKIVRKIWNTLLDEIEPKIEGRITSLLPNGRNGFISAANGKSYYFNGRHMIDKKAVISIGLPVLFRIRDSYDAKKKQVSKEAISIEINKA